MLSLERAACGSSDSVKRVRLAEGQRVRLVRSIGARLSVRRAVCRSEVRVYYSERETTTMISGLDEDTGVRFQSPNQPSMRKPSRARR